MGKPKNLKRNARGKRPQLPLTLIMCQGKVTEPGYFKKVQQELHATNIKVKSDAVDPLQLVNNAKTTAKREEYEIVFIVVDVDDTLPTQFQQAFTACKEATNKKTKFTLIVSNPCFELWLYAHVRPFPQNEIEQKTLEDALKKEKVFNPQRPKHISEDFDYNTLDRAMEQTPEKSVDMLHKNPSTTVPHLIRQVKLAKPSMKFK